MKLSNGRQYFWIGLAVIVIMSFGSHAQANIVYQPIDFSAFYNAQAGTSLMINGNTYRNRPDIPGCPFNLMTTGDIGAHMKPVDAIRGILELNVSIPCVREVHTLINKYWVKRHRGPSPTWNFSGPAGRISRKNWMATKTSGTTTTIPSIPLLSMALPHRKFGTTG